MRFASATSSLIIALTTMRRVVILGGNGQLARSIMSAAQGAEGEDVALGRADADLCDAESLRRAVAKAVS